MQTKNTTCPVSPLIDRRTNGTADIYFFDNIVSQTVNDAETGEEIEQFTYQQYKLTMKWTPNLSSRIASDYDLFFNKAKQLEQRRLADSEIAELKKQLSNTDYRAIKYAEGELSAAEYAETKALRQSLRARINELGG